MSYFLLGKINHDKKCYKFVKKMLKKGSQTPKFMIRLYLYWGSGTPINRVRYLNPQGTRLIPNSNFYVSSFKMLQNMVEYL